MKPEELRELLKGGLKKHLVSRREMYPKPIRCTKCKKYAMRSFHIGSSPEENSTPSLQVCSACGTVFDIYWIAAEVTDQNRMDKLFETFGVHIREDREYYLAHREELDKQ